MRPWQAILLILALLFFAVSSGWSVLYKLTYVLLTLFVLSWLWARYSLRKLTFHRNTTNATTIRDYAAGDAMNRIHWRSSAHHNQLMVKEFDLDPAVDAWVFLDLHDAVQAGEGEQSTEEYAVTIAATIATYLLRHDLS